MTHSNDSQVAVRKHLGFTFLGYNKPVGQDNHHNGQDKHYYGQDGEDSKQDGRMVRIVRRQSNCIQESLTWEGFNVSKYSEHIWVG